MKKGIIIVSFGTSEILGLKQNIENINNKIKKEFKEEYEVLNAFTSKFIIKKLKEVSNIHVLNFTEALDKFYGQGIRELIVLPLYIMPGGQYEGVKEVLEGYKERFNSIKIARPLLSGEKEDFKNIIVAMKDYLPKDKNIVLVGHGTKDKYHEFYKVLEDNFYEMGIKNIHVGTLEGYPTSYDLVKDLKEKNIKDIFIAPFLIVCGSHVNKDINGEENKNSWKNVFKDAGFNVTVSLKSLGEYEEILDLYVERIRTLIK